jgi:hypothetical protein
MKVYGDEWTSLAAWGALLAIASLAQSGSVLSIEPVPDGEARITWPPGYFGFTLESKAPDELGTINTWLPLQEQLNGAHVVVTGDSNRIFRLRK